MAEILTVNSDFKDMKVVFQNSNEKLSQQYEALSETDPALQRLDIYSGNDFLLTTKICRDHQVNLGILCQDEDFESFYQNLLDLFNSRPLLKVVVLLKEITFDAASRLKANPNVIDIKSIVRVEEYSSFRELVVGLLRRSQNVNSEDSELEKAENVQKGLLVGHDDWAEKKLHSAQFTMGLIKKYDLSNRQSKILIISEKIYFPWLSKSHFERLTEGLDPEVGKALEETATWVGESSAPKSVAGLIVTLANYLADLSKSGRTAEEISSVVTSRPLFLKHSAIRSLSRQDVATIFGTIQNWMENVG